MRGSVRRIGVIAVALCVAGTAAQSQYGENQRGTIKDSDVVAAAFPEVEGIELLSPAFINPSSTPPGWTNGTDGPTDDAELDYFLRSLANRNDWMNYLGAEFTSEEGRPIPYLYLSQPNSDNNTTKLKVYIQAAIHGDEPAGDQGLLALLGAMDANQTWTTSLLSTMDIKILPRYNPDGVAYFQRELATNFDPNRDHIKLARPQSRAIKQVFSDFNPHISIDLHEFTAPTIYGGSYQHAADALISGGINLNIRSEIRAQVLDRFVPAMGAALEARGLRWEPYVTGTANSTPGSRIEFEEAVTEARTGRNAYGLTQTISFLLEMRGIRLADQHFQRRVATALTKLTAILNTARDNAADVYSAVEGARAAFIDSDDDIVVTDAYTPTNRTFTLVNRDTGAVSQVPVSFTATTGPRGAVANITRARPAAYLLPRPWSDVATRLRILGLDVTTLDQAYRGTVQALNITASSLGRSIYEGAVLNSVATEPYEREVVLPAGSFWVSTRQANAALAFTALEPENVDSYVKFGIIPVGEGDEYPVFRVMG